ncbi:MAG TPA: phosphoglycerate mutase family protein [Acidimicrobiia bacterium]|nr:phosphoglycerate mutase family protein [Acidimicrobiia bacterium]
MTIYLVRHAKAGDRSQWRDEDWLRPLSRAGSAQARDLVTVLRDARVDRILSSRYVRCMETVVPLAGARGLPIEVEESLAEGGDTDAVLALVRKHLTPGAVMCSHGDVIPAVLASLATNGVALGPDPRCPKGCIWMLDGDGSDVTRATYLPPPNAPGE